MISIVGFKVIRNFGWIEDPIDIRDIPFNDSPLASAPITDSQGIDNSCYFKAVSNQLNLPACVANACADMMEAATILEKTQSGLTLDQAQASTPDLSRLFIWWNARNAMDPNQTNNPNSGTFNRLAMDTLSRHGVCTEDRWPYDPTKATVRPSIMAYREAFVNRFDAFYSINSDGDDRLTNVIQALNIKHNVLFGTALENSFLSFRGTGVINPPTGSIVGRHAMVICGWDPARQAFLVRNSWSPNFGFNGYCWMSSSYIAWKGTTSLWVATKGAL